MLRRSAVVLIAVCALVGAGCESGSQGPSTSVVVTRDFGTSTIAKAESVEATAGLTVLRQLETNHKIETAYGGRYVKSIDGVAEDGDSSWLFYVDGVESKMGATSIRLKPGAVVQWDIHPWQTVRGGGAIVGAYPKPLKARGVRLICAPRGSQACRIAREGLTKHGIVVDSKSPVKLIVGPWKYIDGYDDVPDLTADGESNGAYAEFDDSGSKMTTVSPDGSSSQPIEGGGLLAAFAPTNNPVWIVTGTDEKNVEAAAKLLDDGESRLKDKFAFAIVGGKPIPLPEGAGQ